MAVVYVVLKNQQLQGIYQKPERAVNIVLDRTTHWTMITEGGAQITDDKALPWVQSGGNITALDRQGNVWEAVGRNVE